MIQPFLTMVVFTIFFGKLVGIPSEGVPYAVFSYTGLLFWQFFSSALNSSSNSFVANQPILQKIYFPRVILPISASLVSFVDFIFSAVVFVGILIFYHVTPGLLGIVLVIPALLITFIVATSLGLILATLNVKYRDVRYALPFFIQLLLFVTPVIYPVSIVSGNLRPFLALNPMSGVIETMRASLLGLGSIDLSLLGISLASGFVLFIIGFIYFSRSEREFADVI